jgi:hypothetical protein
MWSETYSETSTWDFFGEQWIWILKLRKIEMGQISNLDIDMGVTETDG